MIGLIAVTATGRASAAALAAAWPGQTRTYHVPARQALPQAWSQCEELVCFLAVGATVRLISPLLDSKWTDPAVVCVDESGRHAVAVVGGHAAGANALAARVAEVLGAEPVITTATESAGLPGLDTLGWPTEGAIGAVSRAMLDGEPVRLEADATWPLPALPVSVGDAGTYRIRITDELVPADPWTAVLRPPSLAVGVEASSVVTAEEVLGLADGALAEAGLSAASVTVLATAHIKAGETGVAEAARERGWPLVTRPASRLAAAGVPDPGGAGRAAASTPGTAEAAALAAADDLVVPERSSTNASVAVARIRPRGRLALIGLGPGARDLLTPRAVAELRRVSVVAGVDRYVDQIRDLMRTGTRVLADRPGEEQVVARAAVAEARRGHAVALVSLGDAGMYAMASPVLDLAGADVDVVEVPGITVSLAAAALLGAPLGPGHAGISLCAPHTPWEVIESQVRAAAQTDLALAFTYPRSHHHDWRLKAVLGILGQYRPPQTPAAVVREVERPGQQVVLTTLGDLDPMAVDVGSVVIIGSTGTRVDAGRMVTPGGW